MKNHNVISMISGQFVPYSISYFPSSVIPKDDVVLHGYVPTSPDDTSDAAKFSGSLDNQFDRSTQTSFRGIISKGKNDRSYDKIKQLNRVFAVEDDKGPSSLPPYVHYPSDGEKDNIYQPNLKGTSQAKTQLMRSASYEKAILSSMRELNYNIKCENKVFDPANNEKTTPTKKSSSKTFKYDSDTFLVSTSPRSSNRSLSSTLEKWMKRTSFKKSNSLEHDKGLKLLKHEQIDTTAFNDDESELKGKLWVKDVPFCEKKNSTSSFFSEGKSKEIEMKTLVSQEGNENQLKTPSTTDIKSKTTDNKIIVIGFKEKRVINNDTKNSDTDKMNLNLQDKDDKKEVNKLSTRKSSRADEILKKSYSYYPEGGGGGGGGGSEYPYLREMKERLLIAKDAPLNTVEDPTQMDPENQLLEVHQTPVGTVVKLNADGYGSHTSPTHRVESFYTGTLESRKTNVHEFFPKNAKTSSFITLSMLYATLLVVVCLGFVLSEVLTHNVPLYYYEAFFTYLYGISILFLLYVFCYLLSGSTREHSPPKNQVFMKVRKPEVLPSDGSPTQEKLTTPAPKPKKQKTTDNDHSHGSFFLRIGAIAFGLGTMIYNGLEFGVFFEIPMSSPCYQILRGVNPLLQLIFTFMQMYFIFMNARLNIHKFKFLARFGLMHIVATNICVWVRTLVRESLKEINEFRVTQGQTGEDYMIMEGIRRALENRGLLAPNRYMYNLDAFSGSQDSKDDNSTMSQQENYGGSMEEDLVNRTCGRMEIMGSIVSDSAPYLYPFIIEYSLIGASVVYIMWKHIGRNPKYVYDAEAADGMSVASRRCHAKVDCIGASKGLFCGLLVLVATLICLILFFVLIHREELRMLAIYLADVSHCGIMLISIIGIFIGFCRVRHLKFFGEREEELDDILLMVSAFGLFAYAIFSAVAGSLSAFTEEPNLLVMVTGILSVIQVMIQIVFIKDTQRRQVALPEQERTKPGRQIVTFLLICNLAMFVIYTFETQKVEANPVQLEFFGKLSWTILLRCTIPLAIFHRFHSSVVLAAIWKNSYKTRLE